MNFEFFQISDMATGGEPENSLKGFDCSVCSEIFSDPQVLPCGHLFCGPPKNCLTNLCNGEGYVKCAICNILHKIDVDDLSPLYGTRDAIENIGKLNLPISNDLSDHKNAPEKYPPYSEHSKTDCEFWCNDCREAVCHKCIDDDHRDCNLRMMKYALSSLVNEALERLPLLEEKKDAMSKILTHLHADLEDLKEMSEQHEKEIDRFKFLQVANDSFKDEVEALKTIGKSERTDADYAIVSKFLTLIERDQAKIFF